MKPNCYNCKYRRDLPYDAHSACFNRGANVTGAAHGIKMGWFLWPVNFDPVWLESCDGFKDKNEPEFAYEATLVVSIDSQHNEASMQKALAALSMSGLGVTTNAEERLIKVAFTVNRELNEKEQDKMRTVFDKSLNDIAAIGQWTCSEIRRQSEQLMKQ